MFNESEHPRDNDGKFTDKGEARKSYTQTVNDRIKWAKENGVDLPLNSDGSIDDLKLQELYEDAHKFFVHIDKQEYAVLRKEVMRKNSRQKGKVKPINFAYTSNYFYVYNTKGGDNFQPLVQLDIEDNRVLINDILSKFKRN